MPTLLAGLSLLGFMAMYLVMGVLFLYLVMKQLIKGPEAPPDVAIAATMGAN